MPLLYETARKGATINEAEIGMIVDKLKPQIAGEVRMDKYNRLMYSTDASMYQMTPIGVVIPRTADDVEAAIRIAKEHGVPVMPRGGGTALAGQTTNHAIIIDFSKYMRNIVEVSPEERWAKVQPGIVNNHLSAAVRNHGLMYGPDPVTSARATIGGGIGNNSCGPHSVIYGKTLDHILEVDAILSDGSRVHFAPTTGSLLEDKMSENTLEGAIYRETRRLAWENSAEIEQRFPKILRRVMGYNLDDFMGEGPMNLTRAVVGSEGTLVAVTEAKVNLVPVPQYKGLGVVHFTDLIECMEASVPILEHSPSAVELIGHMIIDNCKVNAGYRHLLNYFIGEPRELLLVEFYGDSPREVQSKLEALKADMEHRRLGYATMISNDPQEQRRWYALREAGLGLAMALKGDAKPLPYVEDTAVSPEQLPEYVRRFEEIVARHDTESAYYGHASTGCLHIRPVVNMKQHEGVEKMASIAEEISDLVLEFGGSLTGEHGDGIVRGVFTEKMFGSDIYQAFKELKSAFDPDSIMNPGKIIETPGIRENLRIGPDYKTFEVPTYLDFSEDGGFSAHVEMCNSQGACRKLDGGMCPSFMVTRDEEHSTRARATMLRMIVSGALPAEELTGDRLYQTMDLCVECKACKAECPSNVDMAKLKYEFLNIYHQENGYGLNNRFFGNVDLLSKMGAFFAPISNWMMNTSFSKQLLEKTIGIDKRRQLPNFAPQTFQQWFRSRVDTETHKNPKGMVVLFPDTTTNYNHPELGIATVNILEKLGYEVILPNSRCCGRPMLSNGMMSQAKANVDFNISSIYPFVEKGAKLVGIEPSCALGFISDFSDLASEPEKAKEISENTMLIEDFFLYATKEEDFQFTNPPQNQKVVFHGHCHQKALVGTTSAMEVLKTIPGLEPVEIKSGCCGMAGSFGFYKDHFDISTQIGEDTLFPAIREENDDVIVVSEGVSCRQQIEQGTQRKTKHLVELLSDYI